MCGAAQEQIDRGLGTTGALDGHTHMSIRNLDVPIGRHDEHNARFQGLTRGDRAHGERAVPRQDVAEMAGMRGAEVLCQHDRSGEAGR